MNSMQWEEHMTGENQAGIRSARGERSQRLLYLNPTPDGTPIVRLGSATEGRA